MKPHFTLLILLSTFILFSSSKKKESINTNSFVNTKWCIDEPSSHIVICFKSDNTFWHYYSNSKVPLDSLLFCKWGIENDKIYFFDNVNNDIIKFNYIKIISCDKNSMIIKHLEKNKYMKFLKKI